MMLWLIIMITCLFIEAMTVSLVCIWFAGGALIALIAAALHAPLWLQVILFLLVSLVLLFFTRPIAVKYFNKDRIKTNAESLVGKQAIVTAQINNLKATGEATVNGQHWTARSAVDSVVITEGAVVEIKDIKGVKLIVQEVQTGVNAATANVETETK